MARAPFPSPSPSLRLPPPPRLPPCLLTKPSYLLTGHVYSPFAAMIQISAHPAKTAHRILTQLTPQSRRVCPSEKVSGPYLFQTNPQHEALPLHLREGQR